MDVLNSRHEYCTNKASDYADKIRAIQEKIDAISHRNDLFSNIHRDNLEAKKRKEANNKNKYAAEGYFQSELFQFYETNKKNKKNKQFTAHWAACFDKDYLRILKRKELQNEENCSRKKITEFLIQEKLNSFLKIWVTANWYRLLVLRIKREFSSAIDIVELFGSSLGDSLKSIETGLKFISMAYTYFLGHLGWAVYLARLVAFSIKGIPLIAKWMRATGEEKQKAGEACREFWEKNGQSILNDVIWMTVGAFTSTLSVLSAVGVFAAPLLLGTALVAGLYLFDVLNAYIWGKRRKKRLKKKIDAASCNILAAVSQTNINLLITSSEGITEVPKLSELIDDKKYHLLRKCPAELRDAYRYKLITEALTPSGKDTTPEIYSLASQMNDYYKNCEALEAEREKFRSSIVETSVLFGGMAASAIGTATVTMLTGGIGSTTGVMSAVMGLHLTGAALSATGVGAIVGLSLLAIGSTIVIGMCIYRLIKMIKKSRHDAKTRNQGNEDFAESTTDKEACCDRKGQSNTNECSVVYG